MSTPAIECDHVTHRYGDFTAIDDLSLTVAVGETMGLLGPNGAGKTTLVRLLTTLTPVQDGQVHIFGLDTRRRTMDIRQNLGYVPQQLSSSWPSPGARMSTCSPVSTTCRGGSAEPGSTTRCVPCSCSRSPIAPPRRSPAVWSADLSWPGGPGEPALAADPR